MQGKKIVMLKSLIILLILGFSTQVSAQKSEKVIDLLLQNKRAEALKLSEKLDESDVENYYLKQIVLKENGDIANGFNYLEGLLTKPNFEPYLFASWHETFLFSEYESQGFSPLDLRRFKEIKTPEFKDSSLESAYTYMKSIHAEAVRDFDGQKELVASIKNINNWEHVGPFENLNDSGLNITYAPENEATTSTGFDTNGNGIVNWYVAPKNSMSPYKDFSNHDEYGNKINYAQTFIQSDKEQRAVLHLGRGGIIKVFLNDVEILEDKEDVRAELDAHQIEVTLNAGTNRLLIKSASSGSPYYIARFMDTDGKLLSLGNDLNNKSYKKGTESSVNTVTRVHPMEAFFKNKLKSNPNDFLSFYGLYHSLHHNARYKETIPMVKEQLKKYPQSSLLNTMLMNAYSESDQSDEAVKVMENMMKNDPDYYQSLILEFADTEKLMKLDQTEFRKKIAEIQAATNMNTIKEVCNLFVALRNEEEKEAEKILDRLIKDERTTVKGLATYAGFYNSILNDEKRYEQILTEANEKYFSWYIVNKLSGIYSRENRKEEWEAILKSNLLRYDFFNSYLQRMVYVYNENKKYEKSLELINQGLKNYPDALRLRTLMGDTYLKLENKKEAIKWYEEKLDRSLSDLSLRRKVYDLKGITDPMEKIKTKDHYKYIEKSRNSGMENDYGLNILLEENNLMLYRRGGVRYHGTMIYEVTTLNGIESIKEYDLGLGGNYVVTKSEIVKKDNSIEPAERSGSSMVFNNLEIGDVVYLDYETEYYTYGRFYKDYDNVYNVRGYHPIKQYNLRVITESDKPLYHEVVNGDIPVKKYKTDGMQTYEWSMKNVNAIELAEDYMKNLVDQSEHIHISTLQDWKVISEWYSDLVRSQIEIEDEVKEAYKTIFPNGHQGKSDDQKAKAIYDYITDEFTYSYVSFKQSGYVPQKPSKTIKSKLGDCKDFSTLFVTLASMSDLEANLVLILTSDYGENALKLPSRDFNHCIVKTKIDGKDQFLELTDKYLPYKSIPGSLNHAIGLEIPYENKDKVTNDLFILENASTALSQYNTTAHITINNDDFKAKLNTDLKGSTAAYLRSLADEENEELKKDNLKSFLENRSTATFDVDKIVNATYNHTADGIVVETELNLLSKPGSIGKMKTFQLPLFSVPYTQGIIEEDNRQHDILYRDYEDTNSYTEHITIELEEGKKFIEVPESKQLNYKKHRYSINYKELAPNKIEVIIVSKPSLEDIKASEYAEFKAFVQSVIETREQYLAYK
ncbi:MAG: transglutaminase domain-containing protein [Nonlabens sp.]|uniref:transglutaminase domain-containing protein n=1 Tax=Nonlabens sp. TaxID=1888209 RepID=UPI003EF16FB1